MPMQIFTLVFDSETKALGYSGNMAAGVALQLVQRIVISEAVKKAQKPKEKVGDNV